MGPSIGTNMPHAKGHPITVSKGITTKGPPVEPTFGQRVEATANLQRSSQNLAPSQRSSTNRAAKRITKSIKERRANIAARKKREKK